MFALFILRTQKERELVAAMYEDYGKCMYKAAYQILRNSYDAEDAVMEAFCRISDNIELFTDENKPKNPGYLVIIARNAAIDIYNHRPMQLDDRIPPSVQSLPPPDEQVFDAYAVDEIKREIRQLPEIYQTVIYLHAVYELSIEQISAALQLKQETARKRLYRAKKLLKAALERG